MSPLNTPSNFNLLPRTGEVFGGKLGQSTDRGTESVRFSAQLHYLEFMRQGRPLAILSGSQLLRPLDFSPDFLKIISTAQPLRHVFPFTPDVVVKSRAVSETHERSSTATSIHGRLTPDTLLPTMQSNFIDSSTIPVPSVVIRPKSHGRSLTTMSEKAIGALRGTKLFRFFSPGGSVISDSVSADSHLNQAESIAPPAVSLPVARIAEYQESLTTAADVLTSSIEDSFLTINTTNNITVLSPTTLVCPRSSNRVDETCSDTATTPTDNATGSYRPQPLQDAASVSMTERRTSDVDTPGTRAARFAAALFGDRFRSNSDKPVTVEPMLAPLFEGPHTILDDVGNSGKHDFDDRWFLRGPDEGVSNLAVVAPLPPQTAVSFYPNAESQSPSPPQPSLPLLAPQSVSRIESRRSPFMFATPESPTPTPVPPPLPSLYSRCVESVSVILTDRWLLTFPPLLDCAGQKFLITNQVRCWPLDELALGILPYRIGSKKQDSKVSEDSKDSNVTLNLSQISQNSRRSSRVESNGDNCIGADEEWDFAVRTCDICLCTRDKKQFGVLQCASADARAELADIISQQFSVVTGDDLVMQQMDYTTLLESCVNGELAAFCDERPNDPWLADESPLICGMLKTWVYGFSPDLMQLATLLSPATNLPCQWMRSESSDNKHDVVGLHVAPSTVSPSTTFTDPSAGYAVSLTSPLPIMASKSPFDILSTSLENPSYSISNSAMTIKRRSLSEVSALQKQLKYVMLYRDELRIFDSEQDMIALRFILRTPARRRSKLPPLFFARYELRHSTLLSGAPRLHFTITTCPTFEPYPPPGSPPRRSATRLRSVSEYASGSQSSAVIPPNTDIVGPGLRSLSALTVPVQRLVPNPSATLGLPVTSAAILANSNEVPPKFPLVNDVTAAHVLRLLNVPNRHMCIFECDSAADADLWLQAFEKRQGNHLRMRQQQKAERQTRDEQQKLDDMLCVLLAESTDAIYSGGHVMPKLWSSSENTDVVRVHVRILPLRTTLLDGTVQTMIKGPVAECSVPDVSARPDTELRMPDTVTPSTDLLNCTGPEVIYSPVSSVIATAKASAVKLVLSQPCSDSIDCAYQSPAVDGTFSYSIVSPTICVSVPPSTTVNPELEAACVKTCQDLALVAAPYRLVSLPPRVTCLWNQASTSSMVLPVKTVQSLLDALQLSILPYV